MKFVKFLNLTTIIFLGLFLGCARYKSQPLNPLITNIPSKKEQAISFNYYVFNSHDCKKFLDRDVLARGYQPVQITINNNTNRYINFEKGNISLPSVFAKDVANKVHTNTVARATSYGVAGLFLWPFLIPAVVDGVGSSQANQKLDQDFADKELHDQSISPYSKINGLIFVPREHFNNQFTITVLDLESRNKLVLSTNQTSLKI